ncbi:MAG TPA: sugar transferase [Vicinamibacterales bacterium]|jgi:sugar transferase EpsL
MSIYRNHLKRSLDVCVAAVGLLLTAPALLTLAIAVKTRLGSPVFFVQTRPGLRGQPFRMVKFRTMTDARDAQGNALPDGARLTRFGRFLRSTSLDELPELWNVLTGDMSLVGPRPLLTEYLDLYTPAQRRRHDVRPGITGLAQVNGRNALTWDEKFAFDLEYVRSYSFGTDVRILLRTLGQVISRRGVTQPGHASAERFMGSVVQ